MIPKPEKTVIMNLSLTSKSPGPANRKTSALAKVYTKDGRSIRVPLRLAPATGASCSQHPERQFIRWFTRQSAANPGFPVMVKSILFVVSGKSACSNCDQSLTRFLQRFQLADKLQRRNASPQAACGCQNHTRTELTSSTNKAVQTELDQLLSDDTQQAQEMESDVFDGRRVNPQIPSGTLDNQWFKTLRQAREAALATARQLGAGYTIGHHANPRKGTSHFHVVSPAGTQISGHFFYGENPRFIPKTQAIPPHRSGKLANDGRRRRELELEQEFTAKDVIATNIDVHAQYAIQRMMKSNDPAERADGIEMLTAIKNPRSIGLSLDGIYKEDQKIPAQLANDHGMRWWEIIKPSQDATVYVELMPKPVNELLLIVIIFRDSIRSNPKRLDPALRQKWQRAKQIQAVINATPPADRPGALDKLFDTDILFAQNPGKVLI